MWGAFVHPNINKWSKWKPVSFNKVTPITEGDLQTVNYGINTTNQQLLIMHQ